MYIHTCCRDGELFIGFVHAYCNAVFFDSLYAILTCVMQIGRCHMFSEIWDGSVRSCADAAIVVFSCALFLRHLEGTPGTTHRQGSMKTLWVRVCKRTSSWSESRLHLVTVVDFKCICFFLVEWSFAMGLPLGLTHAFCMHVIFDSVDLMNLKSISDTFFVLQDCMARGTFDMVWSRSLEACASTTYMFWRKSCAHVRVCIVVML